MSGNAAGLVLGGDRAQAQRADVAAARNFGLGQHFDHANTVSAREQRRDVAAAIDRRDVKRVAEAVERDRARQRDDVTAVDQAAAKAVLGSAAN